ncbi:MAG: amidohydrolase [Desulfobacterales bacterium PC51MH44]|nr:MAG: amidohydrolase [Desulfobacterales bacterium PC51MH44]
MVYDLVIHNGVIVTVNPDFDIIENGFVCIKNGRIERIEARSTDFSLPGAKEIINAKGGIIMPGLVNTHTHLPMTLFRGLADDLPLLEWLHKYIFSAEAKHINSESVKLGALLACAEMILSGTTTCCDGYFFEDKVASAVYQSGMRAVLGQGVIDFPAPGVPDPSYNIKNAVAFTEKWQGLSPLITPSIFCHSPYTCSAETLKRAKDAAASKALLFQIHTAETKDEQGQIRSEHRATPVQFLDRIGILDQNTLLVHTIWVDNDDINIIAKRRAKVSHNPESNMKLAAGIAPITDFLKAGITVGLGTDGCASNNNLDLFQEMDFTAKLHKVNTFDPTVMDARTVLQMATIDGAKAIGLDEDIGSLEIGKQADLIIIDTDKPHLVPMYNPLSHIVYTVQGSDVRDVIVAGKILVRDQNLLTIDLEDILERATEISKVIKQK